MTDLDGSHCSWEKGLPTRSPARWPTDPWVHTQFLSQANQWSSKLKLSVCLWRATRLVGPMSPACDRYIQYLLAGANPSVLNQHRRGLYSWWCRLFTYHSPTFPNDGLPFPPKGPHGLLFNHRAPTNQSWVLRNLRPPQGLSTTRPPTVAYNYA
jgi:hypothetical protein